MAEGSHLGRDGTIISMSLLGKDRAKEERAANIDGKGFNGILYQRARQQSREEKEDREETLKETG